MLVHITPRYYLKYADVQVDLIDVMVPEFNLVLKDGVDITIRTPYINKLYKVVCRKKGKKAIDGIFIILDGFVEYFTVITRWAVNGEVATHKVHYHVVDNEFDAVTESIMLWSSFSNTEYKQRTPVSSMEWVPATDQPRMVTVATDNESSREETIYNYEDKKGVVIERTEFMSLPTVEESRLTEPFFANQRLPAKKDAFIARPEYYDLTLKVSEYSFLGVAYVPLADWIREVKKDAFDEIDSIGIKILEEIGESAHFFFANTNDLLIKAQKLSQEYSVLESSKKELINKYLSQPVFNLFIDEGHDGETQAT